jgi:hypothetical protein
MPPNVTQCHLMSPNVTQSKVTQCHLNPTIFTLHPKLNPTTGYTLHSKLNPTTASAFSAMTPNPELSGLRVRLKLNPKPYTLHPTS